VTKLTDCSIILCSHQTIPPR